MVQLVELKCEDNHVNTTTTATAATTTTVIFSADIGEPYIACRLLSYCQIGLFDRRRRLRTIQFVKGCCNVNLLDEGE